jgi:hypothetical protein
VLYIGRQSSPSGIEKILCITLDPDSHFGIYSVTNQQRLMMPHLRLGEESLLGTTAAPVVFGVYDRDERHHGRQGILSQVDDVDFLHRGDRPYHTIVRIATLVLAACQALVRGAQCDASVSIVPRRLRRQYPRSSRACLPRTCTPNTSKHR